MRYILMFVFNLGTVAASWYAVHGNTGCETIVKLLAIMTLLFCPLTLLVFAAKPKPKPLWEQWFSHASDAATVGILAWHGWLWCSLAFSIGWIACWAMFVYGSQEKVCAGPKTN